MFWNMELKVHIKNTNHYLMELVFQKLQVSNKCQMSNLVVLVVDFRERVKNNISPGKRTGRMPVISQDILKELELLIKVIYSNTESRVTCNY